MDTIFALASARGKAGIAVVRISGPSAWSTVESLAGVVPPPRVSSLRKLVLDGDTLDEALVLVFAENASFTGEQSAELHVHGAAATIAAVLSALSAQPGLRMAEAGEFTRRALENGRLDLAQVEGLADLIEAETEAQRRQALRVMSGAVGQRAEVWRKALIRAAALLEATIDFADEDVPVDVTPEVFDLLGGVAEDLGQEIRGFGASERIRVGYEVAIVGRPNAGKSTLLNALAGRDAAITSDVAGTTRDVIEVRMDLGGLAVTFLDTAGLRGPKDTVEALGIDLAVRRARDADLRVFLLDGGLPPLLEPLPDDILVQGKADLSLPVSLEAMFALSGKTGAGVSQLVEQITKYFKDGSSGAAIITRERHRQAIERAIGAIESARDEVRDPEGHAEIAAEELHRAIRALDTLVGRIDVEHLLDEIFASFCIGK
ncbi:MAG: tRNA uridine-5-carboxymethylaminomethyl(34) synthesis GTPase MnmE [Paracoccaceae bacterium]|nr:tRNA uridine-5-carboxymethylaminomethyl(34) synthesis GTPase MnmE [Paracoccaceae bacterium]